ncbi:CvpA family protein [Limisalsivibrio acetivorans]|uniref:CvpA family protein n=1 Tax=Limisalsivibrio acetivorans TaxID=1304888 RepID=UPI0003B6AD25|nr:CvpA family protein [Limisalsivibrio acetivorans]
MGIIDIVILTIIGIFALRGLFKGLVHEVFGVIAIVGGYLLAFKFDSDVGSLFRSLEISERAINAIGFVIVFIVAYLLIMIVSVFISRILKDVKMSGVNRGGGLVFGGLKSAVIITVILGALISFLPDDYKFVKVVDESPVASTLVKANPVIYDLLSRIPGDGNVNPFKRDMEIDLKPADMFKGDNINETLERVKEKTGKQFEDIRDAAAETGADIKEKAGEKAEQSKEELMKSIENLSDEEKDALVEKLLAPDEPKN